MDLLNRLVELEQQADRFGFSWERASQIIEQIESECLEVQDHLHTDNTKIDRDGLQEEIGDLLHAAFSLCVFCDFDVKDTINNTANKFESRLNMMKKMASEQGLSNLSGYTFDKLINFWDEAKSRLATPEKS